MTLILVVEHDSEIGQPIVDQLTADGYEARLGHTAEHARTLARMCRPGLAILGDLERRLGSLDLLREIRGADRREDSWPTDLPVIVVSSRAGELDLLRAFEAGADDFLVEPVARYLELRARVRAVLRRAERPCSRTERIGALVIEHGARAVSVHGYPVRLRRLEYELLLHLARDPGRVFAKQELMRAVWGYATPGSTRTLDSHASRLRRKLNADSEECWVVNVRGVGYRLI
jgi:DNA-binding response OmpR family regulator